MLINSTLLTKNVKSKCLFLLVHNVYNTPQSLLLKHKWNFVIKYVVNYLLINW